MIIVLTNDDGIKSEKIQYTRSILEKFGTVYTIAPREQQSAKSMALTIGGFKFEKIDEFNYAIEGTPVDCITFAHGGGAGVVPDLVVSGTNNGYNIGIDIRYSGTLGACFQAQHFGYKTIALSADRKGNSILEQELEKTIQYILDNDLTSEKYTLNVNFPREKFETSNGTKLTDVYRQRFEYKPEVVGNKFVPHRQYVFGQVLRENTDALAYKEGYTSISKVKL